MVQVLNDYVQDNDNNLLMDKTRCDFYRLSQKTSKDLGIKSLQGRKWRTSKQKFSLLKQIDLSFVNYILA